jgi:hypothetical protein
MGMASAVGTTERATEAAAVERSAADAEARPKPKSGFIIGPIADSIYIIGAPLLALVIALPLFMLPDATCQVPILGKPVDLRQAFLLSFVMAHLVLVVFRSHTNAGIFWSHPIRFTVVPALLFASMASSSWIYGFVGVLAVWWDVYHSSLQTFGFGRIYDAKKGNNPDVGRKLDIAMNLFLYLGPVLAGAQFAQHIHNSLNGFDFLLMNESPFRELVLQKAPDLLTGNQRYLTFAVLGVGIPFLIYYVAAYYRLACQGYRVSWQKVTLLVLTGSVSIYVWGFRSFFDAFWVMNFFHALQYFAIVFHTEKGHLARLFRVERFAMGAVFVLFWIVMLTFVYGFWAAQYASGTWALCTVQTVAIMHFWYDSFIWSVRKKQVT